MIVPYNIDFYGYLKRRVLEFQVDYLNNENPFLKNYVYVLDGIPVGLISFSIIYDRVELEYIWTDTNYRRMGVASKLLNIILDYDNINNITLEVSVKNENAIRLYEKYGFKIVSTRKNYYGHGDAYLMMKEMM